MSNANAQPQKEKGLKVGSQVRCFKLTTGTKQDGSMWGMLTHTEKDSNKNIVQKYTIWLTNDSNFIANFPLDKVVDIRIEQISGIRPEWKRYMKDGKQVTERIINIDCGIGIVKVMDNNYNTNNTYNNNNYQSQAYQPQQPMPESFDVGENKFKKANAMNNQPPRQEVQDYLDGMNVEDLDLPF